MSRRPAVMGVAAVVTLIVLVLAAKDQSDKLSVMTAANQDYQRMTDSQAERIRRVQQQLEEEREKVKQAERRHKVAEADQREKAEREIKSGEKQMNSIRSEANHVQQEYDALKRDYEELSQNSIKVSTITIASVT